MGNLLSTEEFDLVKEEFENLMESEAQFYTLNSTSDGGGGRTSGYTATGSPVPCHLMYSTQRPPKEEEGTVLKQVKTYAFWDVWFPVGTTCKAADIFVVGTKRFQVVTTFSPRTYEFAFHVVAAVVDEGAAHA